MSHETKNGLIWARADQGKTVIDETEGTKVCSKREKGN